MNKTFKKILSVCCTVVTTLTATLFRSTEVHADNDYKIVFIGDPEVGKTRLAKRIATNEFSKLYRSTILMDCSKITTNEQDTLHLNEISVQQLGQTPLVAHYYNAAHVLLYCCSIDQLKSHPQNCNIAQYNIPRGSKVLICITQADTMTDDTSETKTQLGQALKTFQTAATECNILPEILVTSAMKNQYKFCTPDNYDTTDYKDIHQSLAADLVNLCRGRKPAQNKVKSDQKDGMCEDSGNARRAGSNNTTTLEIRANNNTEVDENTENNSEMEKISESLENPECTDFADSSHKQNHDDNENSEEKLSMGQMKYVVSDSTTTNTQKGSDENTHNEKKSHMGYWSKLIALLVSSGLLAVFGYYGHDRYKKKKAVNHPTGKHIQHENKKIKRLLNN